MKKDSPLTKNGIPILDPQKQSKITKEKEAQKKQKKKNKIIKRHQKKLEEISFNEKTIAVYWDIENISQSFLLKKEKEYLKKANKKYLAYAEETLFKGLLDDWIVEQVPTGKDSADYALIKEIKKDIENFNVFIIISNDQIFLDIINELLEKEKIVLLIKTDMDPQQEKKDNFPRYHSNFILEVFEREPDIVSTKKYMKELENTINSTKQKSIFDKVKDFIFKILKLSHY